MPAPSRDVQDKLNICFFNDVLGKYITVTKDYPNKLDMQASVANSGPNPQIFEIHGLMSSVGHLAGDKPQRVRDPTFSN